MHSRHKAGNETRVLSETSVDHCKVGMNEVECCLGQMSSEAVDREHASEQDGLDQTQRPPGKVWQCQGLDCAEG